MAGQADSGRIEPPNGDQRTPAPRSGRHACPSGRDARRHPPTRHLSLRERSTRTARRVRAGCRISSAPSADTGTIALQLRQDPRNANGAFRTAPAQRPRGPPERMATAPYGLGLDRAPRDTASSPSEASDRKVAEPADKPGSVVDSHSSRRTVTGTLEQPTRTRRGQRHEVPIWSCSRWGLPCRSVARLAVRSYRTISPLPSCLKQSWAVSFCCTFRRLAPPRRYLAPCPVEPGLSSASPDASTRDDATVWPTPPRALSHAGDTADRRPVLSRWMPVPATW